MNSNKNRKFNKSNYIVIALTLLIALSIFRQCIRNQQDVTEIEMNVTNVEVDGKQFEVHIPKDQKIDDETLNQLLNDPETKEFLEESD